MTRTFVDSGVLYARFRGNTAALRERARELLIDPHRVFLASPFLVVESLPHARRENNADQEVFLSRFFERCEAIDDLAEILRVANAVILDRPFSLVDALHVAAAHLLGADELITTESKRSARGAAFYNNRFVKVVNVLD